jgi:hypothetical protein
MIGKLPLACIFVLRFTYTNVDVVLVVEVISGRYGAPGGLVLGIPSLWLVPADSTVKDSFTFESLGPRGRRRPAIIP